MVVLDASIILKWLLTEEGSERALLFRERHIKGEERIAVPSLLFYEIANVLRYSEGFSDEAVLTLFETIKDIELSAIHPPFSDFEETIIYARSKQISVYDAAYVVLARNLECDLITADRRLVKATGESFVKEL